MAKDTPVWDWAGCTFENGLSSVLYSHSCLYFIQLEHFGLSAEHRCGHDELLASLLAFFAIVHLPVSDDDRICKPYKSSRDWNHWFKEIYVHASLQSCLCHQWRFAMFNTWPNLATCNQTCNVLPYLDQILENLGDKIRIQWHSDRDSETHVCAAWGLFTMSVGWAQ